jgi:excisionase family DNA binding protein
MSIMTIMSKTSKEIKPYLSTGEVARICHMSRATVFNWVKDGKLKASRVPGGRYNIFRRDFLSFMKKSNLLALVEENSLYQETRILIVDDQIDIIETIKTFLEKTRPDFHVTGTTSGFEAGQLVYSFKPDIVILDIIMPKIDGFAVCRKIKSDPLTRDINVIAVTGYPSEENIERIKKEGASFCLEKPLDFNELLDSLKKLIQTH